MAILYSAEGNVVTYHDLQDKSRWCHDGESMEYAFVRQYGTVLGFDMNPEKAINPYAQILSTLLMGNLLT